MGMKKITVTIGKTSVTYVLAATTAPSVYDTFGTLTLEAKFDESDGKPVRLILIREEHLAYQTMRYSSGLYGYATEAGRFDYFDPEFIDVERLLWARVDGDASTRV